MSGDERHDRLKSRERSRPCSQCRESAAAEGDRGSAHEGEFDHPTHPRRHSIAESESEGRISLSGPVLRTTQDSFNPVRVPARSLRPSLTLWTRAWATVALVIVVAGGAVGIVASLRGRTFAPNWRGTQKDRPPAAAAQQAPARGPEGDEKRASMPAAAPGYTAPPPVAPPPGAPRGAVSSASAPPAAQQEKSTSSAGAAMPPRASPGPIIYRTTESLAVSPPVALPSSAPTHARRAKPTESAPRSATRPPQSDEAPKASTPAPATSALPETKGESDAWITEERRF